MSKKAFLFLLFLLLSCVFASLLLGKYGFGANEYIAYFKTLLSGKDLKEFEIMHTLLSEIRLPRILACLLIGASLAISGAAYQAMFVNPLVSPSILGVLAGAGFGAALGMFFRLSDVLIQFSTFAFGLFGGYLFAAYLGSLFATRKRYSAGSWRSYKWLIVFFVAFGFKIRRRSKR